MTASSYPELPTC